jgi:hypothetical protein
MLAAAASRTERAENLDNSALRSHSHSRSRRMLFDSHQLKRAVNHPSINEVFNLRPRGQ